LGQFFCQNTQLSYYIPNRLTESHGLNCAGIDMLARSNCQLIVTCDTGSTNISEILYAKSLGIDVIVTDHHTLPAERPPVTAIINPRYLSLEHQLFHLSGVAVAYKLVEALYCSLSDVPQQPLEDLLDLVAIGLISDLVQLSGDCRYLAQLGIERMQQDYKQPAERRRRPGVGRLLELCQKSGDRPTDISFGLGPRINAVSRIQGDASFCVQLLTSRDRTSVDRLAQETELANTRRKSLQKEVSQQVAQKLKSEVDLSTTSVIVLVDSQWSPGVLGLVAGQIAQETGRPTILLSTEEPSALARGSARSVGNIDLYQLVKDQAHLLHRFGGHPFAAGLSMPVESVPLFTAAINQQLRQQGSAIGVPSVQADLIVTVADLGKDLFLELKLLEPCGMGNPMPKLLIQNCWFENIWHRNQQDWRGNKVQYIKTDFNLRDDSTTTSFPGVWWGHYKDEIPTGRCDCIVELDYNSFKSKQRYEVRLIAVRTANPSLTPHRSSLTPQILDCRGVAIALTDDTSLQDPASIVVRTCPTCWDDLRAWIRRSQFENKSLVLAWTTPQPISPQQIWQQLAGIVKYLSRTGQKVTRVQLSQKLGISDRLLGLGFTALSYLGFHVSFQDRYFQISQNVPWHVATSARLTATDVTYLQAMDKFAQAVQEEQFQRQYFSTVPLSTIQAHAARLGE
jgi:single-stranded-DNA-specific exonuclease